MIREALRRLLWLLPTLLVVTVPTFFITAKLTAAAGDHSRELPLFFNANPSGASERAIDAARRTAAGDPDGARELSRIGGAGLPHVLPLLDSLSPEDRARVAVALAPVARRMGIAASRDLDSPAAAVLFWTRYWDEHSIDFRPTVVKRTVRRFAEHPSALRRAEVLELDTIALGDLVESMRPIATAEDVARVRHVCEVAAHVADRPWIVPPDATVREAREVVSRWERFWPTAQADYVSLAGAKRLAATLLDTRYGRWASELGRRDLGTTRDGRSVAGVLRHRSRTTGMLLGSALFLGEPLGFALAVLAFAMRRRPLGVSLVLALATLLAAAPLGTAALASSFLGPGIGTGVVAMCVVGITSMFFHGAGALERVAEAPHARTAVSFGASPLRVFARESRAVLPALASFSVATVPALITAAFVVERLLSLHGLEEPTVEAIRTGDPALLMALAFGSALALGVLQIASDLLHGALDPRLRAEGKTP
ncbi:MAG TPA: ABC transporter permease subunit [Polyangiaceae bacterium]|nr:ABC transporter permease subunit [Polyangiaceae bacterium]